jgi:hypothetical protein
VNQNLSSTRPSERHVERVCGSDARSAVLSLERRAAHRESVHSTINSIASRLIFQIQLRRIARKTKSRGRRVWGCASACHVLFLLEVGKSNKCCMSLKPYGSLVSSSGLSLVQGSVWNFARLPAARPPALQRERTWDSTRLTAHVPYIYNTPLARIRVYYHRELWVVRARQPTQLLYSIVV